MSERVDNIPVLTLWVVFTKMAVPAVAVKSLIEGCHAMIQTQIIYCGDNLQKLRELPDECIDLIYIDPPFNSNRNYEVFWGDTGEKRAFEDRFGDVEHYIHWMRPRVQQLYRVLKKTGSFYYHCDTHADSYIRVMLDQIFGYNQFRNEIIWKRTSSHNSAKRWGPVHDVIWFYSKSNGFTWNPQYQPHELRYIASHYRNKDVEGRAYTLSDLTAAGTRQGSSGREWRGYDPKTKGNHWKFTIERLEELDAIGRIYWPSNGGWPRYRRYLDEVKGTPLQDVWADIDPINARASERIGYPTQKPVTLLERILQASSSPQGVVLDAFCGCGTTLEAAQRLGRRWIGIDISPTACRVMAKRLQDGFHVQEGKDFWLRDLPKTAEQLRMYPPFEFENWAVTALNTVLVNGHAIANRAKVGDMGIDGRIYPAEMVKEKHAGYDLFGEMDRWFPVQVKQKDKAGRPDIDSFETAMQRQRREKGFFVSFDFTEDARREIKRAEREIGLQIIPITVKEILDEEIHLRL